jgi:ligand-binding sensor domain-containing protein
MQPRAPAWIHLSQLQVRPWHAGTLPDNFIKTLLHSLNDRRGRLWVGTASGGLAWCDRDQDRSVVYSAGPEHLSHVGVMGISDGLVILSRKCG